jgi:hypothetical protein
MAAPIIVPRNFKLLEEVSLEIIFIFIYSIKNSLLIFVIIQFCNKFYICTIAWAQWKRHWWYECEYGSCWSWWYFLDRMASIYSRSSWSKWNIHLIAYNYIILSVISFSLFFTICIFFSIDSFWWKIIWVTNYCWTKISWWTP